MKKGGGKAKGSDFEREQCKRLSLWWSRGKTKDLFWRNLGVPSRSTGARVETQYGDMHAIHPEGAWFSKHINTEYKCYRDLGLLEIVDKPDKKGMLVFQHWEQCKRDALASHRVPLLVQRRNHGRPFVMCELVLARKLVEPVARVDLYDRQSAAVSVFSLDDLTESDPDDFKLAVDIVYGGVFGQEWSGGEGVNQQVQ